MAKPRRLRILVLVDPETVCGGDLQFDQTSDPSTWSMEHHVAGALRTLKHTVKVLPFGPDTARSLEEVRRARPDVVFNLVEHIGGDRRMSPHVPAGLELLGIPYTGCSSAGMSLALDKALSKQILKDHCLAVPGFTPVRFDDPPPAAWPRFPAIVKPRFGGGSEGISNASVVDSPQRLRRRVRYLQALLKQDVICEEYVAGRELSVGVLGNSSGNGSRIQALPTRETVFGRAHEGGPRIATGRVKTSARYRTRWQVGYQRANLAPDVERTVASYCCSVYRHLELTGYARIDMRLDAARGPVFLEANSNPDLSPRVFGIMASWAGIGYEELLSRIIDLALRR